MKIDTAAKDLLFSTVRLVTHSGDGGGSGTGFILDLETHPEHSTPVLITNKHVVDDAIEVSFHLAVSDGGSGVRLGQGQEVRISNAQEAFFGHPDPDVDIAITPIGRVLLESSTRLFYRAIPASFIPDGAALEQLDAIEELVFVGYPDGRWDGVNQTPITRRGITATPIALDFDGEPCFLIDGSVFAGSSGSPVFVYNSGGFTVAGRFAVGQRMMFVGILSATMVRPTPVHFGDLESTLQQEINLGTVFNSRALAETVDHFCANAGITRPRGSSSP